MKKIKTVLATLFLTVVAVISVPSPAAAAPSSELDYAEASGAPSDTSHCVTQYWAKTCYVAAGDKWYILDRLDDGGRPFIRWENYKDGALYRTGICSNRLGFNHWGVCNKDYYESSILWVRQNAWKISNNNEMYEWSDWFKVQ
ncbi:hypothetical protein [Actinoplanes awajinensis]|uniref:hypothetical protein n=1 Tax=Actinoplanes awajinensis TaxID=135946 RepID=UPI000AB7CCBE|nr:hypothetical protein [Actinoplanes awajinensis]